MEKRTTIHDIAKITGVSVATVSNVINGINKVSDKTKRKVMNAMIEMDYQPNLVARSLSNKKSEMIGVFFPLTEIGDNTSNLLRDNPFYAEFISGVEYKAAELEYDVLMKGVRPGQSCREWIMKRNLDGAIFIGNYTIIISNDSKQLGSQLVLIDAYDEGTTIHHSIGNDDLNGGILATKHLLELGHRNIAFAASNVMVDGIMYRRFLGYKSAMTEYGIFKIDSFIYQDSISFDGGYRIGLRLLQNLDKVSAVFAAADVVALGIMKAFHDNGKNIPENLSIIGFDNSSICRFSYPLLTSVDQQIYQKGVAAVEAIHESIQNKDLPPKRVVLPVDLIVRQSTAPFKN